MKARGETLISVAALLVVMISCSSLPLKIGEILKAPQKYENHAVLVRGVVGTITKLPFQNYGSYSLQDKSGSITVVTKGTLPKEGETKWVRGKVNSRFKLLDWYGGTVIQEE